MAKITLDTNSTTFEPYVLNENFRKIAEHLNNRVLYRTPVGVEDNSVQVDIDHNGFRIYNLPKPIADSEPARILDVEEAILDAIANFAIPGPPGPRGPRGWSAYEIAEQNGFEGTQTQWLATLQDRGRKVELGVSATHIQWRYEGDAVWQNLLALSEIKGETGEQGPSGTDARDVEFNKSATHIQWRYVGDTVWIDLVPLADIKGDEGPEGPQGEQGIPGPSSPEADSAIISVNGWNVLGSRVYRYGGRCSHSGSISHTAINLTVDEVVGELPAFFIPGTSQKVTLWFTTATGQGPALGEITDVGEVLVKEPLTGVTELEILSTWDV